MKILPPQLFSQKAYTQGKWIMTLFVLLLVASTACNNDDTTNTNETNLEEVLSALGGEQTIENIKTISYKAFASTFEHGQEQPEDNNPVHGNDHSYVFSSELNKRKIRMDYESIVFEYPFSYQGNGALMIINDQEGTLSGQYNWSSYYLDAQAPQSLYSSRLEAVLKNQLMSNPLELLKDMMDNNSNLINTVNNAFFIPTIIPQHNISLVIDPITNLPERAQVMENDYLYGDVIFEIVYNDWVDVDNTKYPTKLDLYLNGDKLKTVSLSDIQINPNLSADHFTPEDADLKAYNREQAEYGVYSSQWYHRLFAGGIPLDQPLDNGAIVLEKFDLSQFGMRDQTIGPNLKLIGRPDASNWTAAIKTSTGILIVEAPLNPRWTRSIMTAVENEFPGEKIEGVVVSHTHYDHFGGIREIAPDAGTIYVGDKGVEKTKKILNSKHDLLPDAMSNYNGSVKVEAVSGVTYLDNGAVEIHLLKMEDANGTSHSHCNSHSDDMVVVYMPEYETIIQADFLYCGIFIGIWNGFTANPFTGAARDDLKGRAKFLVDYIEEHGLKVSTVVGIHGGVSTFDELVGVSN